VEHISGSGIIDEAITVKGPRSVSGTNNVPHASNSQEFYFKYFLNRKKYPNVIVFTTPFNHAMYGNVNMYKKQILKLKTIMDRYIPRKTKVFFMPTFSEFPSKYKSDFAKKFKHLDRNRQLEGLLKSLYNVMEVDFLDNTSNRYGFVDIYGMSKSLSSWSQDGIHLNGKWHDIVMSMFWELFCNSLELDEF
jgi:hypothetical protein